MNIGYKFPLQVKICIIPTRNSHFIFKKEARHSKPELMFGSLLTWKITVLIFIFLLFKCVVFCQTRWLKSMASGYSPNEIRLNIKIKYYFHISDLLASCVDIAEATSAASLTSSHSHQIQDRNQENIKSPRGT